MGRGKDKTINASDLPNMSPKEQGQFHQLIGNRGIVGKVRISGTAVVRSNRDGNARYEDNSQKGKYNEDAL